MILNTTLNITYLDNFKGRISSIRLLLFVNTTFKLAPPLSSTPQKPQSEPRPETPPTPLSGLDSLGLALGCKTVSLPVEKTIIQ